MVVAATECITREVFIRVQLYMHQVVVEVR
jgi:hypothetical protein